MELNIDCIRDTLGWLIKSIQVEIDDPVGGSGRIEFVLSSAIYQAEELTTYDKKDIFYSVYNLAQCGFVNTNLVPSKKEDLRWPYFVVYDVNYTGHRFYGSIKEPSTWDKTKSIVSRIGNHTLKFIEDTAQMIAVEAAKTYVEVAMTGKTS